MLFDDIPKAALGPIPWVQKALGRHIRKRVADELVVFHSFRHNFRDAARHIGMPDEVVGAIGGWKEGKTSAMSNYGRGHKEARLAEWMDRIEYPGVSFDHLII